MATGSKKVAISNLARTSSAPGSLGDQVHSLPESERLEFLPASAMKSKSARSGSRAGASLTKSRMQKQKLSLDLNFSANIVVAKAVYTGL
jgi:hypothetical protein